jgi:hypothetical protein
MALFFTDFLVRASIKGFKNPDNFERFNKSFEKPN